MFVVLVQIFSASGLSVSELVVLVKKSIVVGCHYCVCGVSNVSVKVRQDVIRFIIYGNY